MYISDIEDSVRVCVSKIKEIAGKILVYRRLQEINMNTYLC